MKFSADSKPSRNGDMIDPIVHFYCNGYLGVDSQVEVHDTNQQVLVLQGKTLIAVPHDGKLYPNILTSTPCRDESLEKGKGNPIYLGVANHKLCLCCAESEGKPKLKLEERDIMELYGTQKAEKSFVFFQNGNGNTSTFESAAYPGWFISSSEENGKPITMTKDVGKDNIHFYFNNKN
ncbi:interleukin-36 alpha-like [Trichosurus vulpecula]|uniref:interleukin-36 alpha-like n=1 Tax=Trichosurus vulpecula TaxID=9337 RepID=UPI00186AC17C|nr:interleukin-36 alpha-like [Trichosurus vulpecula]